MTHTLTINKIPEVIVPGRRLGRHVRHDSRSLAYPVRERAVSARLWKRYIDILDQGQVGSCTGNAEVGAVGTDPLFSALSAGHPALDEAEALRIYSQAETIDGNGAYPPVDDGSSGLSVCTAAKADGLISGYLNAASVTAMASALQSGPVVIGINWYDSFDTPSSSGLISIARGAQVRGGHEVEIRGVDPSVNQFYGDNSWGDWGPLGGSFLLGFADMARLFGEQGDCYQPLPLSVPVPGPVPVPTPTPVPPGPADSDDALFWTRTATWAGMHHIGSNRQAVAARDAWGRSKGFTS